MMRTMRSLHAGDTFRFLSGTKAYEYRGGGWFSAVGGGYDGGPWRQCASNDPHDLWVILLRDSPDRTEVAPPPDDGPAG